MVSAEGFTDVTDSLPAHRVPVLVLKSDGNYLVTHIVSHEKGFTPVWQWTLSDRIGVKVLKWKLLPYKGKSDDKTESS